MKNTSEKTSGMLVSFDFFRHVFLVPVGAPVCEGTCVTPYFG